jgi:hypothetical protein
MTHHVIRVEEDGTRVYSNYTRYKPKPKGDRKYQVRKPDDPRAVRWKGEWWIPREVLPDSARSMPATRQDRDAFDHWFVNRKCGCKVCRSEWGKPWRDKAREQWRQTRSA